MSNTSLIFKPSFIRNPSQNGLGRYVCQLQRLVLKFCKNNGSSRGMREFIEEDLIDFAKSNSGIVVYLKPRRHRTAVITAEYLNGDKQWINCRNFTKVEILKWLNLLKTQQGDTTGTRFLKLQHTEIPSIQGPWTPYTFRPPSLNLTNFPEESISKLSEKTSATKELLELYEQQKMKSKGTNL
ncbi:hypothetical protein WA026_009323 [Henosepilachna vigintioctopunctata]|uniref:Large ribosomal subunit protein mL43 n=1 Tax=Henosepilachna vigintioctopunctata TaxID=420089 RepID=A0AAW1UNC5_9CUCU